MVDLLTRLVILLYTNMVQSAIYEWMSDSSHCGSLTSWTPVL